MRKVLMLLLLGVVGRAAAQADACWRDIYPSIPWDWADYGYVIEAGNRFETVAGATLEVWVTARTYNEAQRSAIQRQTLPATLVETTQSDARGRFSLKRFQLGRLVPGFYEIRAHMSGRARGSAFVEIREGLLPQWGGRGIRVALSQEGKGCSRIYSAGLDDTDCGNLDCENLPAGPAKIIFSDGTPLRNKRLSFYTHSLVRFKHPEFSLFPRYQRFHDRR